MAPIKLERILCPMDFSEFSLVAFGHASSLAHQFGAKLYVQHVVEMWRHPSGYYAVSTDLYAQFSQALLAKGEEQLRKFVKDHPQDGIHQEGRVHLGLAAESILELADKESADVIVMGTHGRQGLDRFLLGSVTEKVLRKARCPVLAVREPPRHLVPSASGRDHIGLRHMLLCIDFSENSNRALEYALALTAEYNCGITLVHVLEDVLTPAGRKKAAAKAKDALEDLIPSEAKKCCRIATIVRSGKAYKEILRLAREKDADLVVLAVRGRNSLDLAVFGSTTYRVIQLGTSPVLAVH